MMLLTWSGKEGGRAQVATCSMGQVATGVHLGPSHWPGLALPCLELHTCCGGMALEKVGRVPWGFSMS